MDRFNDIRERVQRPIAIRNWNFRKPTDEEALAVAEALEDHTGQSVVVDGELTFDTRYLAILDSYTPDSPGWTGKMAAFVWGTHEASYWFRFTENGAEVVNDPNPY